MSRLNLNYLCSDSTLRNIHTNLKDRSSVVSDIYKSL